MHRTTSFLHTDFLDSHCELFSLFWQIILPLEAKEMLTSHDPLQTPMRSGSSSGVQPGNAVGALLAQAQLCVIITDPWNKQRHIFSFQHHDDVTERRGRQGPHSGKHGHDEIILFRGLGLSLINIKSQTYWGYDVAPWVCATPGARLLGVYARQEELVREGIRKSQSTVSAKSEQIPEILNPTPVV